MWRGELETGDAAAARGDDLPHGDGGAREAAPGEMTSQTRHEGEELIGGGRGCLSGTGDDRERSLAKPVGPAI